MLSEKHTSYSDLYASRIRLTCLLAVEQNELSGGPSRSGLSLQAHVFTCGISIVDGPEAGLQKRTRGWGGGSSTRGQMLLPHWLTAAGSCLVPPRMLESTLQAIVCFWDHRAQGTCSFVTNLVYKILLFQELVRCELGLRELNISRNR